MKKILIAALFACASLSQAAHASSKEHHLQLTRVTGGQLDDVVVYGPYAYVANGRTVSTWSHSIQGAPQYLGAVDTPASGRLTGLARSGYYLYANWQTGYGTSGVAVYSLADPRKPRLVNDVWSGADFTSIYAMTAAKRHLYLFDAENGLIVASLADPEKPEFRRVGIAAGTQYQDAFVDGNWIHVFGKNFLFNAVLTSVDISNPAKPREGGWFSGDGVQFFDMNFRSPYAVTFGLNLSVIDLTDPANPLLRGSVAGPPSLTGIVNGQFAYGVGFDGLDVWSIANPDAPEQVSHVAFDTLATDATARIPGGALLLTRTDRLMMLDTSTPKAPRLVGEALMGGSVDAYDAARVGDTVLVLQQNYGLGVLDPKTLDVVHRYEFDLPVALQGRAFNDMHVDGNLAYLAAWGYGLLIADLSNPKEPKELGREAFGAAHTVSVANGYAYLGKNTDGTELGIMDVSNPSDPGFIALYGLPYTPAQVEARKQYVYIASYPLPGSTEPTGLRIVDATDPFGLFEASTYTEDCQSAFGVDFAEDSPLVYVACSTGLHILDLSDPKGPVRLGFVQVSESSSVRTNLEVRGNRAWYANEGGLYEIDVSQPKRPRIVNVTDLAGYGVVNVRDIGNHRLLALTGVAGMHVLESNATLLENHVPVYDLEGPRRGELLFRIEVPQGARELCLETYGGKGDITLYTKLGDPPTATDYDQRSKRAKTKEEITIRNPKPGTWFVKIVGETPFERVTLRAMHR